MTGRQAPSTARATSTLLGVITLVLVTLVLTTARAGADVATGVTAAEDPGRVLLVDDDRVQCPQAGYRAVQEALDDAHDGDRVRVCPGRYAEQLSITHGVDLQGAVGPVASVDCLHMPPSTPDDLDTTRFAILEPDPHTGQPPTTPVRVLADDVDIAGFVIQGLVDDTPEGPAPDVTLYDAAVAVSDAHSGVRLHHNLLRLNTLAVELGGSGERQNRVDHNCFRDNDYAVANQRFTLANGRIDDNVTVSTSTITYEIGWSHAATTDVRVDHNTASDPGFYVVYVDNSRRTRVEENLIRATRRGVQIAPANDEVRIVGNTVLPMEARTGTHGIAVANALGRPPSRHVVITHNSVTGLNGFGVLLGTNAGQAGAVIEDNVLRGNATDGLVVAGSNTGNRFTGNVSSDNGGVGLRFLPGATGNTLVDNVALGNGTDAVDQGGGPASTVVSNEWIRTTCVYDLPVGAICHPPATVFSR